MLNEKRSFSHSVASFLAGVGSQDLRTIAEGRTVAARVGLAPTPRVIASA